MIIAKKEYLTYKRIFDTFLKSYNSNFTTIAISWLHLIRPHPSFLKNYSREKIYNLTNLIYLFFIRLFLLLNEFLYTIIVNIIYLHKNFIIKKKIKQLKFLFISHIVSIDEFKKDLYYQNIFNFLKKKKINFSVIYLNHTKYSSSYFKKKKYFDFSIIEKRTNLLNQILIFTKIFREFFRIILFCDKNINFYIKLKIAIECLSLDTLNNLRIRFYLKDQLSFIKTNYLICTYEGFAYERLIFNISKEIISNVKCIGYQHVGIFENQHSVKRDINEKYDPDIVFVSGKNFVNFFKKTNIFSEKKIYNIGSIRSYYKKNNAVRFKKNLKTYTCLVLPESFIDECNILFQFSKKYSEVFDNCRFIWRLHPMQNFNYLNKKLNILNNINHKIILSKRNLSFDLKRSDFCLYRGSTAVVKAIQSNLYPIYLRKQNEFLIDPLHEISNLRNEIIEINELNNLLINKFYLKKMFLKKFIKIKKYCKDFYSPINYKIISRL